MACFLVSAAAATVVTAVDKHNQHKEEEHQKSIDMGRMDNAVVEAGQETMKIGFRAKLSWLAYLLWGGVALLAFEHIWHGEVVPWFPFLTSATDPAARTEMLMEMGTVGVCMLVLIVMVWIGLVLVTDRIAQKAEASESKA